MESRFFSNQSKKYILLFPIAIIIGAIIINAFGMVKLNEFGIFDERMIMMCRENRYDLLTITKFIVPKRILHFVILFLVCFSTLREQLFYIAISWIGLTFGMIMGALYMQYSLKGLLVFVFGMLIYVMLYCIGVVGLIYIGGQTERKVSINGYGVCMFLIISGIVVEILINWTVFPWIMGRMA